MKHSVPLAILMIGCGGGSDDARDLGADAGGGSGAQFLIHSAVQTDDNRSNYFTVVDSLTETATLDYARSLELAGRARLYAADGIGFFAIGDGEDVTITRYQLGDDGAFSPGASVSLQQYGVSSMAPQGVHFVSPTKAYYKDDGQAQIIVWNPSEMAVERSIALPEELLEPGWLFGLSQWATRPGEAYLAASWTSEQYDMVHPGTALIRIDTETDELTVTRDDRCRGISKTRELDGTLYFFSDVINGFGYAVHGDDGGQQDCILRVLPDETAFDADYVGTLAPALGEAEIGSVMSVTADGRAWVQVVDTTMAPTEPGTSYGEWYANGWSWWHLDLATLADPVRVPGPAGAYSGFTLAAGSSFFVSQTAADYSETTLLDLSGDEPSPGVSFSGFVLDVAQIR